MSWRCSAETMNTKTAEYFYIAIHVVTFVVAASAISALVQFVLDGEVSMTVTLPASVAVALASAFLARRRTRTGNPQNHGTE